MKTKAKLKQKQILFSIIIGFLALVYIAPVQAQVKRDQRTNKNNTKVKVRDHRNKGGDDPYARLKLAAKTSVVNKSNKDTVRISINDPNWQATNRPRIEYVPFKLEDKDGNPISPNKRVSLKNGKIITAQEFIDRLNTLEQKLNSKGFSLRDNGNRIVSKTITKNEYLEGRKSLAPKSIGSLKKGNVLKNYMKLEKRVGVVSNIKLKRSSNPITLKPYSRYSISEKKKLDQYVFSKSKGTVVAKKKSGPRKFKEYKQGQYGNLKEIYESNKKYEKKWKFGNESTFMASMEGSISRYAKIYPFDRKNPEKSMSEFRVSATGKVSGSLFDYSINILEASGEFYAPAEASKKMSAKIQVKALETTIFNFDEEYTQSASFSENPSKKFDKSYPIEVPIIAGVDFKGLIGIKGEVGFEYGASIYRTFVEAHAKPIINIEGYVEAGLEFFEVIGGGIRGELTFIKGDLELQAFAGIWNQNSKQIVIGINHYFGYNLEMLNGSLSAYAEICAPVIGCYRIGEHEFFDWNGFKSSGTITESSATIPLVNIAEYEAPVLKLD